MNTIAVTYPVPEEIVSSGFKVEVVHPMRHRVYGAPYSPVDYKLLKLATSRPDCVPKRPGRTPSS